jgi:hypothetical protein
MYGVQVMAGGDSPLSLGLSKESIWETVFSGDYDDGTHNKLINTEGADKVYFIRQVNDITDATDPTPTLIAGTWSNLANCVDDNFTTSSDCLDATSTTDPQIRFDYGSILIRDMGINFGFASVSTLATLEYRYSNDAVGWSSWITARSSDAIVPKTTVYIGELSFRYIELRFVGTVASNSTCELYQVYDKNKEHGINNMSLQIYDTTRNSWVDSGDITFSSLDPRTIDNQKEVKTSGLLPFTSENLRLQLTNTGKCNVSMTIVKVFS